MTPKIFRDADATEKKEEQRIYWDSGSTLTKQEFLQFETKYYNEAIDHAASVVEEFYQSMVLSKTIKTALIEKLKALKK